ncbi:hypothetical protein ATANTOWER_020222 [Ataeniobius toweri]|uniref:Uncharacterized protein n=1 Tax=Ataeniobius toweri TaxID=208326 RepID=A0ABU7BK29_9TELE|nr:hypothetical protein [Ataeniobius toweri]
MPNGILPRSKLWSLLQQRNSVYSSGLDSADSGDEDDFINGIDPSHDIVDDEEEEEETSYSPEAPSALERGRGKAKSQPSENRSFLINDSQI